MSFTHNPPRQEGRGGGEHWPKATLPAPCLHSNGVTDGTFSAAAAGLRRGGCG